MGSVLVLAIGSNFRGGLLVSVPGIIAAGSFAISLGLMPGLYPSLFASGMKPARALRG